MSSNTTFQRFSKKWVVPAAVLSVIYWLWFGLVVGIDSQVIVFYPSLMILMFLFRFTRNLAIGFSPFLIYMVLYTSLKILHRNFSFPIHIEDLYLLELKFFGVNFEGVRMIWCEYFNIHQSTGLDIFAGIVVIC